MQRSLIVLFFMFSVSGCGEKPGQTGGKGDNSKTDNSEICRVIKKRNIECLEVLVPEAQRVSRSLVEQALSKVEEPRRSELRAQMTSALEKQKANLRETLKEGLNKPFTRWCTGIGPSSPQAPVLSRVKECLKQQDCKGYSHCIGRLMTMISTKGSPKTSKEPAGPDEAAPRPDAESAKKEPARPEAESAVKNEPARPDTKANARPDTKAPVKKEPAAGTSNKNEEKKGPAPSH